jgi:hypothetical protein
MFTMFTFFTFISPIITSTNAFSELFPDPFPSAQIPTGFVPYLPLIRIKADCPAN